MFTEPEPVRLAIELLSRLGLDPDSSRGLISCWQWG